MSVEAQNSMNDAWTRWQGHLVDGVYPLGRCLGYSEHSGVFVTKSGTPGHRELALKLIPASRAQEELQLPRWTRAAALTHPHLLPLLDSGVCRLDGLPYLFVVMEYADQTLAQLLLQRALTVEEARDMLVPMLDALRFLHHRELVQGQLKPANILVVEDQLKLASDTIRQVGEAALSAGSPSVYDPPEDGNSSTAGDIWGLGASLFEALTRRSPSSLSAQRNAVELPLDFPSEFAGAVSQCLSLKPQDRPEVAQLLAWRKGQSVQWVPDTPKRPAALERPAPKAAPVRLQTQPEPAPRAARTPKPSAKLPKARTLGIVTLIALILALSSLVIGSFRAHRAAGTPPSGPTQLASQDAPAPAATPPRAPSPATSAALPGRSDAAAGFALREVIPDVPHAAARTIHGHVKVSVRALVAADGSVSAVLADRSGPSRYFERLAVEAAKKWVFPPAHAASQRLVEIQFDFTRDGTTAHAAAR